MGLDDRALARAGVRILHLGMIWPVEPETARSFAGGLEEVLVVEEKRPFVESQLKELLYGVPDAPRIVGKRDDAGAPLLRPELDLDADRIARAVAARLAAACAWTPLSRASAPWTRAPPGRALCPWPPAEAPSARRSSAQVVRTTVSGCAGGGDRRSRNRLPHLGDARAPRARRGDRHDPDGRRGCAMDRAWRPSSTFRTSPRTSVMAPSSTRARSRSAPRSPQASMSPTSCCSTEPWP